MLMACAETVSILYAMVFGAGDACVRIDFVSIMSAFAVFMVIVVLLQLVVKRLLGRREPGPARMAEVHEAKQDKPFDDDPEYRDSAIRSSRR